MSTPQNGTTPGGFKDTNITTFVNATGTAPRIIADVAAASGNYLGGQRVYDVTVANTDTAANAVQLYEGVQTSLYANMGAVTITGTNTLNRSIGSFITDGYQVGDVVILTGSANTSNNLIFLVVASVTALALVFNGTPVVNTTEGAGFRVIRLGYRASTVIPAGGGIAAGVTSTLNTTNVQLLGGNDATKDTTGLELGANSLLVVSLYNAVTASKVLQVVTKSALR